jgi:FkbM family methyltransferase
MARLIGRVLRKIRKTIANPVRTHPKAAKYSEACLNSCAEYLERLTSIKPKNVFEIGANYFQDAQYLKHRFKLKDSDIYVFEPHPQIFQDAKQFHPAFNAYPFAVSNKNEDMMLEAVDINNYKNNGISSLLKHKANSGVMYVSTKVQCIRMDDFLTQNAIDAVDFLKLDVEGLAYEVLEGFGSRLKNIKAIQVETESAAVWEGQKTFDDIYNLLTGAGFQLIDYELLEDGNQADSFWVAKSHVNCKVFNITDGKWQDLAL